MKWKQRPTAEEKRILVRRWQMRQGYTVTPIETLRNRLLIGALLLIAGVLAAICLGWGTV